MIELLKPQIFVDDRASRRFFPQSYFDKEIKQINFSVVENNGNISFGHYHKNQTDYFYCLQGLFKVGLAIPKSNLQLDKMKSYKISNGIPDAEYHPELFDFKWIYLSEEQQQVLRISPGVVHGYRALRDNSILCYFLTQEYDPQDEFRVKVGHFGENWEIENK